MVAEIWHWEDVCLCASTYRNAAGETSQSVFLCAHTVKKNKIKESRTKLREKKKERNRKENEEATQPQSHTKTFFFAFMYFFLSLFCFFFYMIEERAHQMSVKLCTQTHARTQSKWLRK